MSSRRAAAKKKGKSAFIKSLDKESRTEDVDNEDGLHLLDLFVLGSLAGESKPFIRARCSQGEGEVCVGHALELRGERVDQQLSAISTGARVCIV